MAFWGTMPIKTSSNLRKGQRKSNEIAQQQLTLKKTLSLSNSISCFCSPNLAIFLIVHDLGSVQIWNHLVDKQSGGVPLKLSATTDTLDTIVSREAVNAIKIKVNFPMIRQPFNPFLQTQIINYHFIIIKK